MYSSSRRHLLKLALLGLTAAALPLCVSPAHAAPAFTPKGTYKGTYQSTDGPGSGKFTFKVTSAKPGPNNSFQIKGTLKLGKNALKMMLGTVVADPEGGWIVGGPVFNKKATVLGGIDLRLNPTTNAFTGDYQLLTRQSEPIDGGTITGNKGR